MGKKVLVSGEPVITSAAAEKDIFRRLQAAVRDGTAREKFPVGTIIPDTWTDVEKSVTYSMPLIVVDYRKWHMANGGLCMGATLLRQNALPWEAPFYGQRGLLGYAESVPHTVLNDRHLEGCSKGLKTVIAEVTLFDPEGKILASAFVPSMDELHVSPHFFRGPEEMQTWEYFWHTPTDWTASCEERARRDPSGKARSCWTRSYKGDYDEIWQVNMDGSVSVSGPDDVRSCTPAFVVA